MLLKSKDGIQPSALVKYRYKILVQDIDLEGIIYPQPHFNDLVNMRESKVNQIPHILVDCSGLILGQFVITRIEEKQRYLLPSGLPRKIEFSLNLKRCDVLLEPRE